MVLILMNPRMGSSLRIFYLSKKALMKTMKWKSKRLSNILEKPPIMMIMNKLFEFDDIHRNCDKETEYELEKLGHVDDLDSVCLLTTDILSVTYQEGDLIAEYEGKLFVPWNEDELKSAKKNYLSRRFNVVDGRK